MDEYQLFPGIRLFCGTPAPVPPEGTAIGITYCLDGMVEFKMDGRYFYLTGTKFIIYSISADFNAQVSADYRGLTLFVSGSPAEKAITELVTDTAKLEEKIRQKGQYIAKAQVELLRTFTETLAYHEKSGEAWLKIRAMEILMLISNEIRNVQFSTSEKIPEIAGFVCSHISSHYTIPQLSELFELNPTTLKNDFRRTYGCSVYSYTRNRKMFRAAEFLRETDRKIIDIAADVGYSNASKFAGAFSRVLGANPKVYRTHFRMEQK